MDTSSIDPALLQELLNGSTSTTTKPIIDLSYIYPFLIAFTIISALITILYLINIIQHWRVNRAVLEMRDILKQMNNRAAQPEPPVKEPTETA